MEAQGQSPQKPGQRGQSINAQGMKERRNQRNPATHTHTHACSSGNGGGMRGAPLRAASHGLGSLALGVAMGSGLPAHVPSARPCYWRGCVRGRRSSWAVGAALLVLGPTALAPSLRCPASPSHQAKAGQFGNHSNNLSGMTVRSCH